MKLNSKTENETEKEKIHEENKNYNQELRKRESKTHSLKGYM